MKIGNNLNSAKMPIKYNWLSDDPEVAVHRATAKYSDSNLQLEHLEVTRWQHLNIASIVFDEKQLNLISEKYNVRVQSIKTILELTKKYSAFNMQHKYTITRKEITNLTGEIAINMMKAICELLNIPVSLRGINVKRKYEKNLGSRNHNIHFANETSYKFH